MDRGAGDPRGQRVPPTFLSIPVEIRLQIYSYILPRPRSGEEHLHIYPTSVLFAFDFHPKYQIGIRNVLRTCRAVHAEFSEYLYQRTKFVIVDNIAQDELWLRRYIHVVRHLEIRVTSYQALPVGSHLRSIFHTVAESQQQHGQQQQRQLQKGVVYVAAAGFPPRSKAGGRLSSLTINLASLRPWAERQKAMNMLVYLLEDRRCRIAQALCAIRGLQRFDISGLDGKDVEELLERLRERVTRSTVATSQRDWSFAQRMSATF